MERYLLDTNMVLFLLLGERDRISRDVAHLLEDYGSDLCLSSISVMEIAQLHRIGRVRSKKYRSARDMVGAAEGDFGVRILPFGREHALSISDLDISAGHNDPFDHAIISHAMTERLTLVSSDGKFREYVPQGLDFVFNRR